MTKVNNLANHVTGGEIQIIQTMDKICFKSSNKDKTRIKIQTLVDEGSLKHLCRSYTEKRNWQVEQFWWCQEWKQSIGHWVAVLLQLLSVVLELWLWRLLNTLEGSSRRESYVVRQACCSSLCLDFLWQKSIDDEMVIAFNHLCPSLSRKKSGKKKDCCQDLSHARESIQGYCTLYYWKEERFLLYDVVMVGKRTVSRRNKLTMMIHQRHPSTQWEKEEEARM